MEKLIAKLHPLERRVLPVISEHSGFQAIVEKSGLQEVEVMRALQWLQNKGLAVVTEEAEETVVLGTMGVKYAKRGLPERRFLDALEKEMPLKDIASCGIATDEVNITVGVLKQRAAIDVEKQGSERIVRITKQGESLRSKEFLEEKFLKLDFPVSLASLNDEQRFAYQELKRRRDIVRTELSRKKRAELTELGKKIAAGALEAPDTMERLTPAILKGGLWKNRTFRSYDVQINVPKVYGGKRHFVEQAIQQIKRIWLDMGFREMKGTLVQTSFWDLDALFVPQDHPARDMQDTFYIKDPRKGRLPPVYRKVKATHENGWKTGSRGWGYSWSEEAAKENLLRTHTTVLSAQTIAQLKEKDLPAKFFSVKKVFRNETLSWKSLFEFIQVEGIVVDPDANFKHLKGYLLDFFAKLGFPDARVRPGHFPYTEPSAEVDVWHPGKKQWVELGGSGIFRPEVVQPLMGKAIPVLAWGLGLERSIMEYYRITDIRELYRNDLKQLKEMKVWRQDGIL